MRSGHHRLATNHGFGDSLLQRCGAVGAEASPAAPRRDRAFSMVEVMAASAIFAAGLAAIFTAFSTSSQQFEHQRHTTHGIHLTEAKMEELLLRVSTDAELVTDTVFGPQWFTNEGFPAAAGACPAATTGLPPEQPGCRYRVTWQSTKGQVVARVLTVTTTWNERGKPKSISFSTQRN